MFDKNTIPQSISLFLISLVVSAAAIFGISEYVKLQQQQLLNQAVDDCYKVATVETFHKSAEKDARTTEPIKSIYSSCLIDKKISSP